MHSVVLTATFVADARRARLSEDELFEIVSTIAADPRSGDLMKGTGGARKLRHPGRGKGKSGGYRTIHYYAGDDLPVFLLAMFGKGDRDNLSKAERNAIAAGLARIAAGYGKGPVG